MTRHALYQIVIFTFFLSFSQIYAQSIEQSDQQTETAAGEEEENDDCEEGAVGTWVGGKGRCFFSDDDFLYPAPNFVEDINRETDTWPGKREDPFYDNLTR